MLYKQFHMPTIQYRAVEFILLCKHKTKFKIGYNACRKFSSFTAGQVCNKLPAYKLLCSSLSSRVIFSGSTSRHLKEIRLKWVLESPFDYCILTRTPYNVKGSCRFFHKWRQFPQKSPALEGYENPENTASKMKSQSTDASQKAQKEGMMKRMEHDAIAEESAEEDEPLEALEDETKLGQVVFDPPYSLWRYPKKYKRDDMGTLSGWPGYVFLGLLVLGFSWMSYSPNVPEWAGERFLLQCYVSSTRMAMLLSHPVPYLTGFKISKNDALRWMMEMFYSSHIPDNDPWVGVTDAKFDGVPVKIFRPRTAQSDSPAIIYIHGGGWSLLSADSYASTTYYMAWKLNVVVVSIDYRLAPEHPYPVPFDDCLKATVHFLRNAVKQDVDPNRIAIAGDSAGGNLAAAVALRLSEEDKSSQLPRLKFQVLVYPAVQMFDFNTPSYKNFTTTAWLTQELMIHMWLSYLGFPELQRQSAEFAANNHTSRLLKKSEYGSYLKPDNLPEDVRVQDAKPMEVTEGNDTLSAKIEPIVLDPYFAPLMAPDLSKVPAAYFILAQNDVLRDDGLLYAERLRKAGVKTVVDFHKTMSHGFFTISPVRALTFKASLQAVDTLAEYVKENL